jgi:hypothetical protein
MNAERHNPTGRAVERLVPAPPKESSMPRSHTLTRALAATAAIAALAAPAALARPLPVQDLRSADAKDAAAHARTMQDLRMPDTQDAAAQSQRKQDLRRLAAGGMQTSSLAGTTAKDPVYWAYDNPAPDPKTAAALAQERSYASSVPPAPVQHLASSGDTTDDTPWAVFALGLAGAALAGAGTASIAGRTRLRTRRSRVAA